MEHGELQTYVSERLETENQTDMKVYAELIKDVLKENNIRCKNAVFGFSIEIRSDFIEKQYFRVGCYRAGDCKQLPLSLGKVSLRKHRFIVLRQCHDCRVQTRELCRLHRVIMRNFRIKQRNLFLDRSRWRVKMLLHTAEQMPFL